MEVTSLRSSNTQAEQSVSSLTVRTLLSVLIGLQKQLR